MIQLEKLQLPPKRKPFREQCKKSYARLRLGTLQKHLREQHKMQQSDPSYPTSKKNNCQTPKDDDWTIGNFDIAKLKSELKEGKENLCFDDSDSDAEVRFGRRLIFGSTDDTVDDISSPSSPLASHTRVPTCGTTESSFSFAEISMGLDQAQDDEGEEMKQKDDEMDTTETSSSTDENLASHSRDSVIVEENNFPSLVETTCDFTESSNSFAEISMELDQDQGDVGGEKETEDVEEEQLSLEQQIHSMLKKEKVPLTQAGIRYLSTETKQLTLDSLH